MADHLLPKQIDPYQFAQKHKRLAGKVSCGHMDRLQPLLQQTIDNVELELQGGVDREGTYYLHCRFTKTVSLACQRCLHPVSYEISVDTKLVPVQSELYMQELAEHYEPLLIDDKMTWLSAIVEDELLLGLPVVARHDYGACPVDMTRSVSLEALEERSTNKPFADLKQRMKKKEQDK